MGNEWKIWESCGKDLRWIIKECIQIIHWEQTCIFKAEVCFIRHIYKMIACESLMVFCTNLLHLTGVDINGNAVAQWWYHSLAVRKFPGSNLVRTSPVYPAVNGFLKGYPISDSAWSCQNASLWAPNRQPDCILPRKLRWCQIDTWSIVVIMSLKALWV